MAKDGCPSPAHKARLAKLRRMRKWSRERCLGCEKPRSERKRIPHVEVKP